MRSHCCPFGAHPDCGDRNAPVQETYLDDLPQLLGGAMSPMLRNAAEAALRKVEEERIDPVLIGRCVAAINERFADDDGNGAVLVFLPGADPRW